MVERTVPASTWAVFESHGPMPDSIQTLTRRIFTEWFPSTKYIHAGSAELELYLEDDKFEVWIPIEKE
jgi:AraC family transcriptional regulator